MLKQPHIHHTITILYYERQVLLISLGPQQIFDIRYNFGIGIIKSKFGVVL